MGCPAEGGSPISPGIASLRATVTVTEAPPGPVLAGTPNSHAQWPSSPPAVEHRSAPGPGQKKPTAKHISSGYPSVPALVLFQSHLTCSLSVAATASGGSKIVAGGESHCVVA